MKERRVRFPDEASAEIRMAVHSFASSRFDVKYKSCYLSRHCRGPALPVIPCCQDRIQGDRRIELVCSRGSEPVFELVQPLQPCSFCVPWIVDMFWLQCD
jgi:hypothetical protein